MTGPHDSVDHQVNLFWPGPLLPDPVMDRGSTDAEFNSRSGDRFADPTPAHRLLSRNPTLRPLRVTKSGTSTSQRDRQQTPSSHVPAADPG